MCMEFGHLFPGKFCNFERNVVIWRDIFCSLFEKYMVFSVFSCSLFVAEQWWIRMSTSIFDRFWRLFGWYSQIIAFLSKPVYKYVEYYKWLLENLKKDMKWFLDFNKKLQTQNDFVIFWFFMTLLWKCMVYSRQWRPGTLYVGFIIIVYYTNPIFFFLFFNFRVQSDKSGDKPGKCTNWSQI